VPRSDPGADLGTPPDRSVLTVHRGAIAFDATAVSSTQIAARKAVRTRPRPLDGLVIASGALAPPPSHSRHDGPAGRPAGRPAGLRRDGTDCLSRWAFRVVRGSPTRSFVMRLCGPQRGQRARRRPCARLTAVPLDRRRVREYAIFNARSRRPRAELERGTHSAARGRSEREDPQAILPSFSIRPRSCRRSAAGWRGCSPAVRETQPRGEALRLRQMHASLRACNSRTLASPRESWRGVRPRAPQTGPHDLRARAEPILNRGPPGASSRAGGAARTRARGRLRPAATVHGRTVGGGHAAGSCGRLWSGPEPRGALRPAGRRELST